MDKKPTYEELEQRIKELEKEATERKQAKEELKRERNIFLKGPIVIFKWTATENWPAEYVSPNVTQFGYQADDFISGKIQYIDIIYPEDLERIVSEVRDYSESGVAFYEQEYRIIQADGEVRWVYDFTIVRRNDQNEITHYDGYILDTTRRKRAEEALRESQSLLNATGRMAKVGGWEFDVETLEQIWTEEVYHIHEVDLDYKATVEKGIDFYAPESRPIIEQAVQRAIDDGEPFDVELQIITAKGNHLWVHAVGKAHQKYGKTTKVLGTFQDITTRKRAEKALKESEEKYRTILESIEEGYFEVDIRGNFTFFNDSICKILGYSNDELMGMNNRQYTEKEDTKKLYQTFNRVYETGKPTRIFDWEIIRKDGTKRHVETSVSLMKDAEGQRKGFRGIVRDVSDRKQAETALQESETRYRSVFENTGTASTIIEDDMTISMANTEFEKLSGYSKEEMEGKMRWTQFIVKEDLERMKEYHAKRRENERSAPTEYEFRLVDRQGNKKDIFLKTGMIPGTKRNVASLTDITSLKQADEALLESEQRYRNLSEQSTDAIYITNREGKLLYLNQSFLDLFGYTREEIIDLKAQVMYANPSDRPKFQQEIEQNGSVRDYEVKLCKKDGTGVECLITATLRRENDGSILGYQGIIRDITEKKKLEAQLAQAQRMEALGTLAGGIAHNFNNLLMGIQGNTSLMLLETDPTHPNYRRLNNIENMVQNGSKLTGQLLGYAMEGRYEVRPINFNQLVKETSDTFETTRKDIMVHQDLGKDLPGIKADQGQIEQVILNLFVNAADAMPGGGDLFLHTTNVTHKDMKRRPYKPKPGNYVLLTVRDTGVGMDKKTMERIFDPFFTTKGLAKGTGLGLASTYGIIKAHGGYIDVDSKKGQGTTFEIYLPATEKEVIKEKELPVEVIKGKETVLLVDDEDMIIDVGEQMLETLGYNVLIARSGKEAIELYKKSRDKIDMVLLDMVMPGVGGGETYDRMKEINPKVKVLLSSGYSIDGQATEILERGCNGFIQKPFNMKRLSQGIREILDS